MPADSPADVRRALSVLAEPTRLSIVELLAAAPRTIGEIGKLIGMRQPQATKHVQALETAGLVTVYRLGRRRVVALRRETLRQVSDWLAAIAVAHPSESVLDQYQRAIDTEQTQATTGRTPARTLRLRRLVPGSPVEVWRAWTTGATVQRWWAPEHFEVADCTVEPVVGGRLAIVLREPGGARFSAEGRFLALAPNRELQFQLDPLGADATPLFSAVHQVSLAASRRGTLLAMTIRITDVTAEATFALAGIELGWQQSLDKLERVLDQ